jgi:hypothetical protein
VSIFSEYHYNFLKALSQFDVKFLIVGGQAVIYYGVRRGTGDLDLLVEPTEENGKKILHAFSQLNLSIEDTTAAEFAKNIFLGLGFEPDAVDIFNTTPGIEFKKAYERSVIFKDRDLTLNLINIEDLISNKEKLNREGEKKLLDQYDVAVLKKILASKSQSPI